MTGREVLLAVPRPPRDLEGHALVAYHLLDRHGIRTRLFTGPDLDKEMLANPPDAVVLDFLGWPDRAIQARLANRIGIPALLLPTAGVYPDPVWFLRAAGKFTGVMRNLAGFLMWGSYSRDVLLESGEAAPENVRVTGCPRFDFYAPPYLSLITPRSVLLAGLGIPNEESPLVLWSTNTNEWNSRSGRGGGEWKKRASDSASVPEREVQAVLRDQESQFRTHSAVVAELAARHPEWNVLIRVHPLEAVGPYQKLARGRSNLFVDSKAAIRDLLYHSAVVLQRGCTVATEAWMLNKPVLHLGMGKFEMEWATPEHLAGNHRVDSIDEAETCIAAYLRGEPLPEDELAARRTYLERYYYRIDGHSAERCADAIAAVAATAPLPGPPRDAVLQRAHSALEALRRREAARFPMRVKDALHVPRETSLRVWRKRPDSITPERASSLFRTYAGVLHRERAAAPGAENRSEE